MTSTGIEEYTSQVVEQCCPGTKVGSVVISLNDKQRYRITWCSDHPVWALKTTAERLLETGVFPGSTVVQQPRQQTERLFD